MKTYVVKIGDYWRVRAIYERQSFLFEFDSDDIETAEWFAGQFEKAHNSEIAEARKEENERCKQIILRRTGIPKDAKNPTRDAVVLLGEELAELITLTDENKR
jgi:hypothetical protein